MNYPDGARPLDTDEAIRKIRYGLHAEDGKGSTEMDMALILGLQTGLLVAAESADGRLLFSRTR